MAAMPPPTQAPRPQSFTHGPPVVLLGIPFDNVTLGDAVGQIEQMVASGQPHYLVTANVDFLAQAQKDAELRRILCDAHLVLCDGTPLVWASRLLGNPLPQRVAGADLVPLLIQLAAEKRYRLFFLGAAPESAAKAVERLRKQYPNLPLAGWYSPPFNKLLEMDHAEAERRIREARPDLLFVSLGCPKQEKWIAMHYRSLGVPVSVGVGATLDFLAGQVKRAPVWMQRSGLEWIFRLLQEPRRLFRRYVRDLWFFASSIIPQWWFLRRHGRQPEPAKIAERLVPVPTRRSGVLRLPSRLDIAGAAEVEAALAPLTAAGGDWVIDLSDVEFADSTGIGMLIRLQKNLRARGSHLALASLQAQPRRALELMRLLDFFAVAPDIGAAKHLISARAMQEISAVKASPTPGGAVVWRGEITAENAEAVWRGTLSALGDLPLMPASSSPGTRVIDMSNVRFIDSSGLGLMVRARKLAGQNGTRVEFVGLASAVRNVVELAGLRSFLLS